MKTPYAQQRNSRQHNTSALLMDLWLNAPLSRAMLAQRNGLTKATVSAICDELAALNVICDAGQDRTSIGRPGSLLELNALGRGTVGLEISTNYIAVILADLRGETLWRQIIPSTANAKQETVLSKAEALLASAIENAQQRALPLLGIGVAAPGIVDSQRGVIVRAASLGWKETELKERWEARFLLPVMVENKARSAAMTEALRGSARGVRNFVYVSIGTDIGSSLDAAVMIDGVLFRGAHGLAVNAGHMILDPDGELCACGQRGCWRAQADVARETALVKARLAQGVQSVLRNASEEELQNHRVIHQAALDGDPLAGEVFKNTITYSHAPGILNLIHLFNPELVLLGYASAVLPDEFLRRMEALMENPDFSIAEAVRKELRARGLTPPDIRLASYEPYTSLLGAAMLLVDAFLREPPAPQT